MFSTRAELVQAYIQIPRTDLLEYFSSNRGAPIIASAVPLLLDSENPETDVDARVISKTWIQYIIRAIEENLAKNAPKCFNKCCNKIRPRDAAVCGWKKRSVLGAKQWLCDPCSKAYILKQFCEFCAQIYLETTLDFCALDGKEWAQCEYFERCHRWAHVECLIKKFGKTREEVMSDGFQYICCDCKSNFRSKKRSKAAGKVCDDMNIELKRIKK